MFVINNIRMNVATVTAVRANGDYYHHQKRHHHQQQEQRSSYCSIFIVRLRYCVRL